MEIKRGIAVSPGVAIGPALVLDSEGFRIPQRFVPANQLEAEVERLRVALAAAAGEARSSEDLIALRLGKQYGSIFGAHAILLADPALRQEIETQIRSHCYAAEYAVSRAMRLHAKALEDLGGSMSTRIGDLFDLEKRILSQLLGQSREQLKHLSQAVVVIAHDLTPSETADLDARLVHGFATEAGGRASHTAIVAGVMQIPAVVGLGKFVNDVSGGDLVIVDGNRGMLIVDPDDETLQRYERARITFRRFESDLSDLRDLRAVTRDGTDVRLHGNIEFPQEGAACLERGADGVGLYRTEFLYLGKEKDPTEAEHLEAYLTVLRTIGPGKPLTIRTLDLGADKFMPTGESAGRERNPFLGLRSVRLCLRNLPLFKTQMRAILRASAFGDVRIMFPMISTLLELRQCKMILAEVKEDLQEEGLAINSRLPVGTMIEVPAAAILAEQLAREVDFFSIGTNDLVQYTLAADRNNEAVADLYNAADPAVLRLIDMVVRAAQKADIGVTVCGEMSGDPVYTQLLLGLGLRSLSMAPHNLLEVKKIIRSVTVEETVAVAREALSLDTARDVNNYLREQTRRILPEVVN